MGHPLGITRRNHEKAAGPFVTRPLDSQSAIQCRPFQPTNILVVIIHWTEHEARVDGTQRVQELLRKRALVLIQHIDTQLGWAAATAKAVAQYQRKDNGQDKDAEQVAPLAEKDL